MKKAANDMQAEAKLRLMTMGKSEEEAAKIRADYLKNYNEAEARGQGQMFKEVFATGTVQSKEASMQVALQGKSAAATVAQASAMAKGNAEAAKRHNEDATKEMGKLNNNTAYLSVAMMGTGEASKSVQKSMLDTRTAYNNEKAVRDELLKDEKNRNLSKDDLEKKVQSTLKDRAGQAQEGKNAKGEDVSGATKAAIQLGNRVGDVNSALMNGLVTPLNKEIGPKLGAWSDKYLKSTTNVRTPDGKGVKQTGFTQNIEENLEKGYKAGSAEIKGEKPEGTTPPKPGERGSGWKGSANKGAGNATGDVSEGIGRIVGNIGGITATTIDKLTIDGKSVPGRATGSLGMTGNLFEDFGKGSLTMLHGKEAVMTEDQLKKMASGFQTSGIESAVSKTAEQMGKVASGLQPPDASGVDGSADQMKALFSSFQAIDPKEMMSGLTEGIDIGQISKDISTTFSSVGSGTGAGASSAGLAQSKIDEAIAAKDAAYEKLQKLWNEGSDEDLNANHEKYAEELRAAKENLATVIDESMSDLSASFDDYGDVFEDSPIADAVEGASPKANPMADAMNSASPKANPMANLDTSGIVLGPNGLPIPGSMKAKSATIASDAKQKEQTQQAKEDAQKTETAKKAEAEKKGETKTPASKQASLDDVVKSLESLNKTMNRLLATSEDLGNKQVKATKSVAASKDLYNR
jgi:hypothetical protein